MKAQINHITTIRTGVFAKPYESGDLVYLQARHFDEYGILQSVLYPDLPKSEAIEKHLLQPGDVLFAAKGSKNFASVYEAHNPPAVASTSFFVISIKDNSVLPEYLAWFLNSIETQTLLKMQAIGTSIPSISKHVLELLEIPIPSLETQKKIAEIAKLRHAERTLKQRLELLKEKQIQQIINLSIKIR